MRHSRCCNQLGLVLATVVIAPGCVGARAGESRLTVSPLPGAPGRVAVELDGDGARRLRAHLRGQTSGPALDEVFHLTVIQPGTEARAPVLARVEWVGESARLVPHVSLTPGIAYAACFDGPRLGRGAPLLTAQYSIPADRGASHVSVTAVHPRLALVPANLLKFYVHFSRPMGEGRVFEHVRLLDGRGKPVPQAFREVELWADDHRRLTLWVNPGRTKRSLGLSESLGAVLEPGRSYTLELLPGLPDQRGRPLVKGFQHAFRTTPPDQTQPRIESWKIETPPAGVRDPVIVRFAEPMDHALAARVIRLETSAGGSVDGAAQPRDEGRSWCFIPAGPWTPGAYRLVVGGELEDLAGNSLYRSFETRAGDDTRPVVSVPEYRRDMRIGQ